MQALSLIMGIDEEDFDYGNGNNEDDLFSFWHDDSKPKTQEEQARILVDEFLSHPENRFYSSEHQKDNIASENANRRYRMPLLATFFDSIDPNLNRSSGDSSIMAELKMYGRSAKNVRDEVIHIVSDPLGVAQDSFLLGADIIDAGLQHLGVEYHPAAKKRNQTRVDGLAQLWNADGLTQREAILTIASQTLLFGGLGKKSVPKSQDFRSLTVAENIAVDTLQFSRTILHQFRPLDHTGAPIKRGLKIYQEGMEIIELHPSSILPSQSSVKASSVDIYSSIMSRRGWGDFAPLDIVRMEDGRLFTFDHRRLVAAERSGINAKVIIHGVNDVLPPSFAESRLLKLNRSEWAKTWGDAINMRINKQHPKNIREDLLAGKLELKLR